MNLGSTEEKIVPNDVVPEEQEHTSAETKDSALETKQHEVPETQPQAVNGHDAKSSSPQKTEEIHESANGSLNPTFLQENHEDPVSIEAQPPQADELNLSSGGDDVLETIEVTNGHLLVPPEDDGPEEEYPIHEEEISAEVSLREVTTFPFLNLTVQDHELSRADTNSVAGNYNENGSGGLNFAHEDVLSADEGVSGSTRDLFALENDDPFNGDPDPEAQGYTLIKDEDDEVQERWESEGANTSADVHYAENGDDVADPECLSQPFSEEEDFNDQFAAFSQIQGSNSESAVALEFVAHQLVDPSNPVPHGIEHQKLKEEEPQIESMESNDIWGSAGDNEAFDFGSSKNPGEFDDDFDPTNKRSQETPEQPGSSLDDPFAEISASNVRNLSENPFNDEGMATRQFKLTFTRAS